MNPSYGAYHHGGVGPVSVAGFMEANIRELLYKVFDGIIETNVMCCDIPGLKYGVSGGSPVKLFPGGTYSMDDVESEKGQDLIIVDAPAMEHLMDELCCAPEARLELLWEHVFIAVRLAYQEVWLKHHEHEYIRVSGCDSMDTVRKINLYFTVTHALRIWRKMRRVRRFDSGTMADALVRKASDTRQLYVNLCIIKYSESALSRLAVLN